MNLKLLTPKQSLNKAYLKEKISRTDIELFKTQFSGLLEKINDKGDEEHLKSLVADFLKFTWYKDAHQINPIGKNDLVIHTGKLPSDPIGVIIEVKSVVNKGEMISEQKPNTKAIHELILYYLNERITNNKHDIKQLIATNIFEWFIFDANEFDKKIYRNTAIKKLYEQKKADNKDNPWFYEEIKKLLGTIDLNLDVTYLDIRDFKKPALNTVSADDKKLIPLFKILSPVHLLKLSFTNDSNTLQPKFYSELLHIIGLYEYKDGSKKLISRKKEGERNAGSLLENAIVNLDSHDKISRLDKPSQYGDNYQERLYNVALELVITWVNRILFLKLLEAQLLNYHKGDRSYNFLNKDKIKDFDDLDKLFFRVLAKKVEERSHDIMQLFGKVPYLNSSLFEPTELEHDTIFISGLEDFIALPILNSTILKDNKGKTQKGDLNGIDYLFEFLNAYDFSSEGAEEIQEDNKTLINASVLGLIFEKINGYKDGSFFTPGFITMYMCRETIRKAVVQKFNDVKGWEVKEYSELYDRIADRTEANTIINSLKICDPAVGSGHFLVSALNELITIKSDLNILTGEDGRTLRDINIEVVNDELIVTDENSDPFKYNYQDLRSQNIQRTLFHEKQTLIENCLFGVDINPNSVKICRLRLWIELLKNAYYKPSAAGGVELETLPNIDIKIKTGNSLISRFSLDVDLKQALKNKSRIKEYKAAISKYQNAKSKEEKREVESFITEIKNEFRTIIRSKDVVELKKLESDYFTEYERNRLFEIELDKIKTAKIEDRRKKALIKIEKIKADLEEIKNNKIYENAFEWRFEFPEVLDDEGDYVGFDIIIGNPPYLNFKMYSVEQRNIFKVSYREIFDGKSDIYYYFFLQGLRLTKSNGLLNYITSRYWLEAEFAVKLRRSLANNYSIKEIIDFKNVSIFDGIGIKTSTARLKKTPSKNEDSFLYKFIDGKKIDSINLESFREQTVCNDDIKTQNKWVFGEQSELDIYKKIEHDSIFLEDIAYCKQGILSGLDKAFVIPNELNLDLEIETLKPWLKVGDVFKYHFNVREKRSIIYPNEIKNINDFPKLFGHLQKFKTKLENREEAIKGNYRWFDLHRPRNSSLFNSPKLICRYKASENTFALDLNKYYSSADTTIVVLKKEFEKEFDLKFILGLLNSKLLDFYFKSYGKLMDYRYEYYPGPVGKLKIKMSHNQTPFIEIVEKIIEEKNKNNDADVVNLENELNSLVYSLYNLTEEEINIVEGKV